MPATQRVGDANTVGGVAQGGVGSVRVNGRPIIVNGNSVTAHPNCRRSRAHCSASTANGSPNVRAGSIPVVRTGDSDTCGHARAGGSADTRVN